MERLEYDPEDSDRIIREIVAKRTERGCPNCGRPWSERDLRSNLPALGMSCHACHGFELEEFLRQQEESRGVLRDRHGDILFDPWCGWVGLEKFNAFSREFIELYPRQLEFEADKRKRRERIYYHSGSSFDLGTRWTGE